MQWAFITHKERERERGRERERERKGGRERSNWGSQGIYHDIS